MKNSIVIVSDKKLCYPALARKICVGQMFLIKQGTFLTFVKKVAWGLETCVEFAPVDIVDVHFHVCLTKPSFCQLKVLEVLHFSIATISFVLTSFTRT